MSNPLKHPGAPGWVFTVEEVSNSVYQITGKDDQVSSVTHVGTNLTGVLQLSLEDAQAALEKNQTKTPESDYKPRVGDTVIYHPSSRGRALDIMSSPAEKLVPGESYKISEIRQNCYIVVNGYDHPGGGIYWMELSLLRSRLYIDASWLHYIQLCLKDRRIILSNPICPFWRKPKLLSNVVKRKPYIPAIRRIESFKNCKTNFRVQMLGFLAKPTLLLSGHFT